MNFIIAWALSLFKKPDEEFTSWPLPAPVKVQRKRRAPVKKPAKIVAKKPAAKKTIKKKAD